MIRKTLRPQNKCSSCGYTWYPRGKNLSSACPRCKSKNVKFAGIGLIGGAIIFGMLLLGGNNNSHNQITTTNTTPSAISIDTSTSPNSSDSTGDMPQSKASNQPMIQPTVQAEQPETSLISVPAQQNNSIEKIYSEEEIHQMENAQQYHGDDPIVRKRLGLPSQETGKLIP